MLYLTGYKDFSLDDLKAFRQLDSQTPGHPENQTVGVEVCTGNNSLTSSYDEAISPFGTGPLGQGITNAVGMAVAATHLAAEFNKVGAE